MALPRIRLPNIPADVVPYAITPDAHTARAGFGFGGRSSMDRQDEYRDMLVQRGYSLSDAKELAWLEERQAWADRAEENRPPETRTRAQLASQNFSPTEIDRLVGRPTNVEANLAAAATPITLDPVAGARDPRQTAYNAETFAEGYGYDANEQPAYLGRVDIDNLSEGELVDRGRRAYNARDPRGAEAAAAGGQIYGDYVPSDEVPQPLGMTAPGPRTLDGRSPTMPKPLMTPEDVEAYDVRPNRGLSQRDRDMAKRGMVPVVTPDGVSYMRQYVPSREQNDGYQIPGGPGRAGPRPDLEGDPFAGGAERLGYPAGTTPDEDWPKYEPVTMVGPDGNPVQVLRPTAKFAGEQKEVMKTRRAALDADFQKRRAHRIALAQLAGGSQNINSGNRWMAEALLAMKPEERASSMRYMLPGGDLAAAVDAQNMQNSNEVIKRYLTAGAAGGINNPATAAALQTQQLQQQQSMVDWAEQNIKKNYAWDNNTWLPGSPFTTDERDQAIQDLLNRYGPPKGDLTLADATRIVDNIAARKPQPSATATSPSGPGSGDAGGGVM